MDATKRKIRSSGARCGISLYEALLAVTLLFLFLGGLGMFGNTSTTLMVSEALQTDLDTRMRRAMNRVTRELRASGFSSMGADPLALEDRRVEYRTSEGVINGEIDWGELQEFSFALEAGEVEDGLDNNGNGLIDEGRLQWTQNKDGAEERTVTLCSGVDSYFQGEIPNGLDDNGNGIVDEPGFCLQREGDRIVVRLSLSRIDDRGQRVTRSITSSLRPRN